MENSVVVEFFSRRVLAARVYDGELFNAFCVRGVRGVLQKTDPSLQAPRKNSRDLRDRHVAGAAEPLARSERSRHAKRCALAELALAEARGEALQDAALRRALEVLGLHQRPTTGRDFRWFLRVCRETSLEAL